jgi:hypothetical protein
MESGAFRAMPDRRPSLHELYLLFGGGLGVLAFGAEPNG